jgi:hypothetical protein
VLDALAGPLQLGVVEREHLFDLARTANASPGSRRRRPPPPKVRPGVQRVLDALGVLPRPGPNGCTTRPSATSTWRTRRGEPAADPGLTLLVHTAEPDPRSAAALMLLAGWAATLDPAGHLEPDTAR